LESNNETSHYFIAAHAGGTEVEHEGTEIFVITPASPLGQKLMGRRAGEVIEIRVGKSGKVVALK
jgi:transcription elongation GreA/GreB family factor